MKIVLMLGENGQHEVIIERNWFTGKFTYSDSGQKQYIKNPFNPMTHVSLKLKQIYEFDIKTPESQRVKIEHIRPLLFAGLRPQKYEIFVNGDLHTTYKGY